MTAVAGANVAGVEDLRLGRILTAEAREIFEQVALGEDFIEFLTLPAYHYLDEERDTDG